jgi:hypothetical protein
MFGSSKIDPVFHPKADEDYIRKVEERDLQIILRDDADLYDSTSFVITGKDNSLIFIQAIVANMRPMYTNQVGIHIKYVNPAGKATFFSHKYADKQWSFEEFAINIGGFKIARNPESNSYHITVRSDLCVIWV